MDVKKSGRPENEDVNDHYLNAIFNFKSVFVQNGRYELPKRVNVVFKEIPNAIYHLMRRKHDYLKETFESSTDLTVDSTDVEKTDDKEEKYFVEVKMCVDSPIITKISMKDWIKIFPTDSSEKSELYELYRKN